jgi:hypothetical protein
VDRVEHQLRAVPHLGEPPVDLGDLSRFRLTSPDAAPDQVESARVTVSQIEHIPKHR